MVDAVFIKLIKDDYETEWLVHPLFNVTDHYLTLDMKDKRVMAFLNKVEKEGSRDNLPLFTIKTENDTYYSCLFEKDGYSVASMDGVYRNVSFNREPNKTVFINLESMKYIV